MAAPTTRQHLSCSRGNKHDALRILEALAEMLLKNAMVGEIKVCRGKREQEDR